MARVAGKIIYVISIYFIHSCSEQGRIQTAIAGMVSKLHYSLEKLFMELPHLMGQDHTHSEVCL